jgi:thiazole tautomerase (transcriptional regulator TenI)
VTHEDFPARALGIMRALGPRGALHLRSSRASGKELYHLAKTLVTFQQGTGCWLIVNDRLDVAAATGAKGVQLASHSMAISEARLVVPNLPLGASVHTVEEALDAEAAGASWCVAGTVFETPSHVGRVPARVDFIEQVCKAVKIPVIAIGGIRPEDVPSLKRAGAHGIATIRGAGWEHGIEVPTDEDALLKTRVPVVNDAGFSEPITRYISEYDSDSGSGRNDHPDGERSPEGA